MLYLICLNAPLRILAIDDNPSITRSMPFIFTSPRYEVTSSSDGDDAFTKLEANPNGYDVIIVDQKMPHLSGVEVVRGIRERGIQGRVIVLSAHLSPPVRGEYEQMNVSAMIEKPFDVKELRAVVDETTGQQRPD